MTHELAPLESRIPYLATVFQPLQPLVVYGRSARMEPECPGEEAVAWAWRDTVIPLIMDPVFPSDTLFLIFEDDFRFSKSDAEAADAWLEHHK